MIDPVLVFAFAIPCWLVWMHVNWRALESGIARRSVLFSQWNSLLSGEKKQLVTPRVSGEANGSQHPPKATSWSWQSKEVHTGELATTKLIFARYSAPR